MQEVSMKRQANPPLSASGEHALAQYEQALREQEDLTPASLRNYLSDLRHFIVWYEARTAECVTDTQEVNSCFDLSAITTPTLTRYRSYLQTVQRHKPASANRSLVSLKQYCRWAIQQHFITYDPSRAVKLVGEVEALPRHLEDQEEQRLLSAVTKEGSLRDRALIILLLHTGLRAREVCQLRYDQVKLGKRSGLLEVIGKRNKYREVPLNATVRKVLEDYLPTLPADAVVLFPSAKTKQALSERALAYLVKKYTRIANLPDISPHDLRHRFGYRMAESVPLHRLAQIMGHDSLDTTKLSIQGTRHDLQQAVETIAWTEERDWICRTISSFFQSRLQVITFSPSRTPSRSPSRRSLAVSTRCRRSTRCSCTPTYACSPSPARLAWAKHASRSRSPGT
jgi:integrase/recombinase XerC